MKTLREELIELMTKQSNTYGRYLPNNEKLWPWVNTFPGMSTGEKAYNAITYASPEEAEQRSNICLLPDCNNQIAKSFISGTKGYRSYCSNICSTKHGAITGSTTTGMHSIESKNKRKATLIKHYGTNSMISINREKAIETNQEKLGVDYPLQSQVIRDKVKNNLLERGVINVGQLPEVIEKIKTSLLKNHGVTSPLKSAKILSKMTDTMLERHGVKYAQQSAEFRDLTKSTNLERYGAENPMQSSKIAELSSRKQRQNLVINGDFDKRNAIFEKVYLVTPLFTANDYIEGKESRWKHVCGKEYTSGWSNGHLTVCPEPDCRKQSAPQRAVYEYIASIYDGEIRVNDRSVITPYELDIYLPNAKFAVELDGIYWHSRDHEKDLDKHKLCNTKGINLLTITDLSWYSKTEIWQSIISSKLKLQKRVPARKCVIVELNNIECNEFLEQNHLQGRAMSSVRLGLLYHDELVAVMTFAKPRFSNKADWELLRYASLRNLTVVGGASKLLKSFKKDRAGSIISYAKKEYSNGSLYSTLGFKLLNLGSKSYFYLKGTKIVSRYQAQKHKLAKLLGTQFDPLLSEKSNMTKAGYMFIPDKGSMTFIL